MVVDCATLHEEIRICDSCKPSSATWLKTNPSALMNCRSAATATARAALLAAAKKEQSFYKMLILKKHLLVKGRW
jgi:hypothetical protein